MKVGSRWWSYPKSMTKEEAVRAIDVLIEEDADGADSEERS